MSTDGDTQPDRVSIFVGNLLATFFVSLAGLICTIWLLDVFQIKGGKLLIWWALGVGGMVKFISLFLRLWPTMNVPMCILLSCTLAAINTYLSMWTVFVLSVVAFGE